MIDLFSKVHLKAELKILKQFKSDVKKVEKDSTKDKTKKDKDIKELKAKKDKDMANYRLTYMKAKPIKDVKDKK